MTKEECNRRAADCVANAAVSADEAVAAEFMHLAAQWRAVAAREIFLGHLDEPVANLDLPATIPSRLR